MSAIEVDHLTKRYGNATAVDDLTFTVEPGTVTGFLGPNGAGKTTTLRALLGLVRPTSGVATVNGSVGAVLEGSGSHPGRTAVDHLRVIAHATGISRQRIDEVLDIVDLADVAGRRAGAFSLGMRQRLAIATALLRDPAVLILDEPTNGLDPAGVHWLRTLVRELANDGRTVLVSSHLLAEVAQTVDDVVIIDRGRLLAAGPIDDIAGVAGSLEATFLALTENNR